MSKYTTELRFICETASGLDESKGYNDVNTIINNSRTSIFSFDYPIFDNTYKPVLEKKIIKHFYTREIGFETVGRWKLALDARMNEIMPYYNKLYESELLEFNPLYDADYTKSGTRDKGDERTASLNRGTESSTVVDQGETVDGTETVGTDVTGNSTETLNLQDRTVVDSTELRTDNLTRTDANVPKNDHWDYYNDTPQGGLNGISTNTYLTDVRHITDDGTGSLDTIHDTGTQQNDVDSTSTTNRTGTDSISSTSNTDVDKAYHSTRDLDNTTRNESDVNETSSATIDTTEEYAEHVIGKFPGKSYAKMLQEFRETLLNIDMLIIRDLGDLFMTLW